MPDILTFPAFEHVSNAFNLSANVVSPGQTADGEFPLARFDGGGRWVATITNLYLLEPNDVKTFRAMRMASKGGFMPLVVPREDAMLPPFPMVNGKQVKSYGSVPHSDGTFFSDGSGYTQPTIAAKLIGAGELNDTTLTIRIISGSDLVGGESFSLFHILQNWRLYEIYSVKKLNDTDFAVMFDPPLRDDIANGSYVEFDKPRCVMRIKTPDAFNLTMKTYPFDWPTVQFVETVFRV